MPVRVALRIKPLDGGWLLFSCNALAQVFRSGAEAERHARRLSRALAKGGFRPCLSIVDRAGRTMQVPV